MGTGDERLPRLASLLREARRREVVRRVADSLWMSVLAISIALGASIGIDQWTGLDTLPLVLIAGFTTSAVLFFVNLNRRPDALATAITLDRLNHTHDLLSTAWATRRSDQPWTQPVRALAESACDRAALPSPIGRFSPRLHLAAWLGLGSVLLAGVLLSPEADLDRSGTASGAIATTSNPVTAQTIGAPLARSQDASTDTPLPSDPTAAQAGMSGQRPSGAGDDSAGAGRSSEGVAGRLPDGPADANPFTKLLAGATPAAGNGAAAGSSSNSNRASGTTADAARAPVAPWSTDTWAASRDAALAQVSAGRVPDTHRELVRMYFDR